MNPSARLSAVWLLLACLVVVCAIRATSAQDATTSNHLLPGSKEAGQREAAAREQLSAGRSSQLPRMFDFERYKNAFRKSYASALEELVRLKIFMARSWRVFCSVVTFKHRQSGYYLALSERSDWTREEQERSRNKFLAPAAASDAQMQRQNVNNKEAAGEFVEPRELAAQLAEIERRSSEPGYRELARELQLAQTDSPGDHGRRRKRRSTTTHTDAKPVRDFDPRLAFERSWRGLDLTGSGHQNQAAESSGARVASNNPEYQAPELMSQGLFEELAEREDFAQPEWHDITEGTRRSYDQLPIRGQYKKVRPLDSLWSFFMKSIGLGGGGKSNLEPEGEREAATSGAQELPPAEVGAVENSTRATGEPADDVVWVDHRRSGCMTEVKSQRQCGSCYLFATTAFLEWAHCRETGQLVAFSEQYALDCAGLMGERGCEGGRVDRAGEFFGNFGVELAANYPYRARAEMCPYEPETEMTHMGYLRLEVSRQASLVPLDLWEEYLEHTPMVLTLDTSGDFLDYGGGVWDGRECTGEQDHAMVLVGHGREDGEEYWLLRNSYGPSWGEAGHLKLNKNSKCVMPQLGLVWASASGGAHVRLSPERNKHVQQPIAKDGAYKLKSILPAPLRRLV